MESMWLFFRFTFWPTNVLIARTVHKLKLNLISPFPSHIAMKQKQNNRMFVDLITSQLVFSMSKEGEILTFDSVANDCSDIKWTLDFMGIFSPHRSLRCRIGLNFALFLYHLSNHGFYYRISSNAWFMKTNSWQRNMSNRHPFHWNWTFNFFF